MPLSASVLARLHYQHQTVRELIGSLPEPVVRQRIDPAKWSAFENIAHLACYHPMFLRRLERIKAEDNPMFERYVAEADPDFPGYVQLPLVRLLDAMDTHRQTLITVLEGMDETTLQRTALHARYGRMTVPLWADFFLLHEAHHLYTIFMLAQEFRKTLPG